MDNWAMRHSLRRILLVLGAAAILIGCALGAEVMQRGDSAHSWHGLFFVDAKTGFLVGDGARMQRTDDGGKTWIELKSGISSDVRLTGVWFFDEANGVVCGELGTLYSTADGGKTWSRIPAFGVELQDIAFCGKKIGYAVGLSGRVIWTHHGGASWNEAKPRTSRLLLGVACVGEKLAWAVGLGGTILHTSDGGRTWALQDSGTASILLDVCFVDASNGWAVGMAGVILHTTDGGKKWVRQLSGAKHELNGVYFADKDVGFIVGQESIFLRTTDGGNTWQKEILIDRDTWLYSIFMLNTKSGYACGKNGILVSLP